MMTFRQLVLTSVLTILTMAFLGADVASATTVEVKGVAQNKSASATGTLAAGSSLILKDEFGTTTDTCTTSTIKGATEGTYTGASVGGKVSTMTYSGCSHTVHVLKNGSMSFVWTSGTNGFATSKESEVTIVSTFFGASAVCKTGTGTQIGTITGVKEGNVTLHINGTINCGILGNAKLTGTFTGTGNGFGLTS
jgi:hypothetical protein